MAVAVAVLEVWFGTGDAPLAEPVAVAVLEVWFGTGDAPLAEPGSELGMAFSLGAEPVVSGVGGKQGAVGEK